MHVRSVIQMCGHQVDAIPQCNSDGRTGLWWGGLVASLTKSSTSLLVKLVLELSSESSVLLLFF